MHHYIIAKHTKVVADSNQMWYLLNCHLLQGHVQVGSRSLRGQLGFCFPKKHQGSSAIHAHEICVPIFYTTTTKGWPYQCFPIHHIHERPLVWGILLYLHTHKFKAHLSREDILRIWHQAARNILIEYLLYRRSIDIILRRCLIQDEAEMVLNNFHSGACSGHLSGVGAAQNILVTSYFCPSIFVNCIEAVKHCRSYQLFSLKARTPPPTPLHLVVIVGPFYKWEIDFMTINPTLTNDP